MSDTLETQAFDPKKAFKSKTLWVNFIMSGLSFVPAVQAVVTPDVLGVIFFVANTILRFMTKTSITIK